MLRRLVTGAYVSRTPSVRNLTIPAVLRIRQNPGDRLCMPASAATVLNAREGAPRYKLPDMTKKFEETLGVADDRAAGYDNSNFVAALKKLGVNPLYLGGDPGLQYDSVRLRSMLEKGWIMSSVKSGHQKHSNVVCTVDDRNQFGIYDPAYGEIFTYQFSSLIEQELSLDYFIEKIKHS